MPVKKKTTKKKRTTKVVPKKAVKKPVNVKKATCNFIQDKPINIDSRVIALIGIMYTISEEVNYYGGFSPKYNVLSKAIADKANELRVIHNGK